MKVVAAMLLCSAVSARASERMLGRRNKSMIESDVSKCCVSLLCNLTSKSECPPRSKKFSFTLTLSSPRTSSQMPATFAFTSVFGAARGATERELDPLDDGKAARSNFPFVVKGNFATQMNLLGTMYSGSHCRACCRRHCVMYCSPGCFRTSLPKLLHGLANSSGLTSAVGVRIAGAPRRDRGTHFTSQAHLSGPSLKPI